MGEKNCVRLFLIAFNVLCLLAGLAILGLGIWVQVEKGDYVALADSDTGLTGAILIMVVGGGAFVISFIGLLGAIKRNRVFLWIFFTVLAILIIVEIIAVILGMVYQNKVEDELHSDMEKTTEEYGLDNNKGVTDAWDWAQQKFECCGVEDYKIWRLSASKFNPLGSHKLVPDSCCREEKTGCGDQTSSPTFDQTKIYTKGCFNELKEFIKNHLLTIGIAALGFLIIQLVVVILTLILVMSLAK